jgi:hypothetical protein
MSAVIDLTRYPDLRPQYTAVPIGWCCVDDNTYDGSESAIGYGRTRADALADLIEQLEDNMHAIAEFDWLEDAQDFQRLKGRDQFSICAGINMHWAVIPKPVRAIYTGREEPPEYVTETYVDPDEAHDEVA